MTTGDTLLGPFRVVAWPEGPGKSGIVQHQSTLEYLCLRWPSSLAKEVSILRTLVGGSGIQFLHWFQTIEGMEIIITDHSGPTLEDLFGQARQGLSVPALLRLGYQIMSRVEFMHSRGVIHGNLSPSAFALGQKEWQREQILLVDYSTKNNPATVHHDLYAVGFILVYLYHKATTWEEYQQNCPSGKILPVLETFFTLVSLPGHPNYSSLRGLFVDAYQNSITQLGPYWEPKDSLIFATGTRDTNIYDNLNLTLAAIGKSSDLPHTPAVLDTILGLFDEMLQIYRTLLFQDRPSQAKRCQITGAHYLPNRLWRDLRWVIKRYDAAQKAFRYSVLAKVYQVLCVLHDTIPHYRIYWTEYLLAVATEWEDVDLGRREEWCRTKMYWRDVQNGLKAMDSLRVEFEAASRRRRTHVKTLDTV